MVWVHQLGLIRAERVTCATHTDRDYRLIGNLFGITSTPVPTGTQGPFQLSGKRSFSYIHVLEAAGMRFQICANGQEVS